MKKQRYVVTKKGDLFQPFIRVKSLNIGNVCINPKLLKIISSKDT